MLQIWSMEITKFINGILQGLNIRKPSVLFPIYTQLLPNLGAQDHNKSASCQESGRLPLRLNGNTSGLSTKPSGHTHAASG